MPRPSPIQASSVKMSRVLSNIMIYSLALFLSIQASGAAPAAPAATDQQLEQEYRRLLHSIVGPKNLSQPQIEEITRFAERYANRWQGQLVAAAFYEKTGMMRLAEDGYETAWKIGKRDPEPLMALIRWTLKTGQTAKTDALLDQAAHLTPESFPVWVLKATLASKRGDTAAAKKYFQTASEVVLLKLDPARRQIVNLLRDGWVTEAVSACEALLAKNPDDQSTNLLLVAAMMKDGQFKDTLPKLRSAFRRTPLNAMLAQVYARVLLSNGLVEDALEPTLALYAVNLTIGRDAGPLLPALSQALAKAPSAKVEEFSRNIASHIPDTKQAVHFHLSLADLLDRSGRKLPSVRQRRFAVALDPTNVKLRVNLAEYLAQELYDIETAISEYEQAIALVPAVQTTPLCTRAASLRKVLANQRSDLGIGLLSWLRNQNTPLTNFWTSLYEGQMRERLQALNAERR